MFPKTMRHAASCAARRFGRPKKTRLETVGKTTEDKIIGLLRNLPDGQDNVVLRNVHTAIDVDQPSVLKAVRNLDHLGLVQIDTVLHDPLASRVALAGVKLKPTNANTSHRE